EQPPTSPSSAARSGGARRAEMRSVEDKPVTHRRALAEGCIRMGAAAFSALQNGTLQKSDPRPLAEPARIPAAKRTAHNLPARHPLALDRVRITCALETNTVRVSCEVLATAKTGVEMEALSGVNGALLALYDVLKADDPALLIDNVRLLEKSGGKSDYVHE